MRADWIQPAARKGKKKLGTAAATLPRWARIGRDGALRRPMPGTRETRGRRSAASLPEEEDQAIRDRVDRATRLQRCGGHVRCQVQLGNEETRRQSSHTGPVRPKAN